MKLTKYLFQTIALSIALALPLSFSSCDDKEEKIAVSQVCVQSVSDTESVITQIRLGNKLRIEGSGLSSTRQVLINGVEVSGINSNYITDNVIMVTVPTSLPVGSNVKNPEDLNTIRIITKHDNYVFPFTILGEAPSVASLSHTMPKAGERIQIEGSALNDIERVIFPGNVSTTNFTISSDYKTIDVVVPDIIENAQGVVIVEGPNGSASSYAYFNYRSGLFLDQISGNPIYGYGTGSLTGDQSTLLPVTGDGPKNPNIYRSFPAQPEDIPASTTGVTIGGFVFSADLAIQRVIDRNIGSRMITSETLCRDLAIQADYYCTAPWGNGSLRFVFGRENERLSPIPWAVNGEVVPVTFTGWRTITWPLADVTNYAGLTLAELKERVGTGNNGGQIIWIRGQFQDKSGNYNMGAPMSNAQMSIGNVRIVPYVSAPQSEEEESAE